MPVLLENGRLSVLVEDVEETTLGDSLDAQTGQHAYAAIGREALASAMSRVEGELQLGESVDVKVHVGLGKTFESVDAERDLGGMLSIFCAG